MGALDRNRFTSVRGDSQSGLKYNQEVSYRATLVLGLMLLLAAFGVLFASKTGGVSGFDLGLALVGSPDRQFLSSKTFDFLEDIQFKDFETASTYHLPKTQKERDIPELLRRVFQVKHEVLDIKRYDIREVDLDRSKTRARIRTMIFYRVTGDQSIRDQPQAERDVELLFYWFQQKDGSWVMDLESSLR